MLRAKEGFVMGGNTIVRGGQVVRSDDRVVSGREHLFEPLEEALEVEQATRAPGERRIGPLRGGERVVAKAEGKTGTRRRRAAGKASGGAAKPPAGAGDGAG